MKWPDDTASERRLRRRRLLANRTLLVRLRAYLLTGILVTAPIGITLWLTWGIVKFFDSRVKPLIPAQYNPETYLPIPLPGFGLILAVVVLIFIGWLAAGLMGRWLVRLSEQIMESMPIVRNVYSAVKQIMRRSCRTTPMPFGMWSCSNTRVAASGVWAS